MDVLKVRPTTQIRRKAVADVMAVGYWKLAAPNTAHGLVTSQRQKRSDAMRCTTPCATLCSIDAADRTAVPALTAELFD